MYICEARLGGQFKAPLFHEAKSFPACAVGSYAGGTTENALIGGMAQLDAGTIDPNKILIVTYFIYSCYA